MSTQDKNVLPKLPAEQIKKYKQAGQWPPPPGIIILPESRPSKEGVNALMESLANILPPSKRKILKQIEDK